jgi:ubiquinol-cytochrome c reductase cytochrome b subunit
MCIRFLRWRDGKEDVVAGERLKEIVGWALDRFAVKPIEKSLMDRRVAKGAWYYGDGAALFLLFNVLLVTGAFLALSYSPSLEGAYSSVRYITDNQTLGWFVRGLHYWSAGLMVVMLCFHLFRQILAGGYKSPREGTWLIGVLLFFAVIATSYLGYVLRWDERAIYGLRVSLNLFYRVPLIGESLVLLVQGGPHIGSQTLPRIYAVHVIFVPLLLLALVGYHMYLVVVHGITGPTERTRPVAGAEEQRRLYKADAMSEERGETFFPYTAAKSGALAGVVFLIVLVLTLTLGPGRLYPEANLVEPSFPRRSGGGRGTARWPRCFPRGWRRRSISDFRSCCSWSWCRCRFWTARPVAGCAIARWRWCW